MGTLLNFVKDRAGHDLRYAPDTRKIRKLGWRPRRPFSQGLKELGAWYRANESWWRSIKTQKGGFQNYYKKQYGARLEKRTGHEIKKCCCGRERLCGVGHGRLFGGNWASGDLRGFPPPRASRPRSATRRSRASCGARRRRPSISSAARCSAPPWCAWRRVTTASSSAVTTSSATAGPSPCSSTTSARCTRRRRTRLPIRNSPESFAHLDEPHAYSTYAREEATRDASREEQYWRSRFQPPPDPLDLPTDEPRPALRSFGSERVDLHIGGELEHRR